MQRESIYPQIAARWSPSPPGDMGSCSEIFLSPFSAVPISSLHLEISLSFSIRALFSKQAVSGVLYCGTFQRGERGLDISLGASFVSIPLLKQGQDSGEKTRLLLRVESDLDTK